MVNGDANIRKQQRGSIRSCPRYVHGKECCFPVVKRNSKHQLCAVKTDKVSQMNLQSEPEVNSGSSRKVPETRTRQISV